MNTKTEAKYRGTVSEAYDPETQVLLCRHEVADTDACPNQGHQFVTRLDLIEKQ